MSLFEGLSLDPKVIIIVLAIAALSIFVYFSWKKTTLSISELENSHKHLQKQLAHGVISDEKINPLRIENASNISEETMDYEYEESETEGPDHEAESGRMSEVPHHPPSHHQHHPPGHQNSEAGLAGMMQSIAQDFKQHYGIDRSETNTVGVPGHELIGELRGFKSEGDIIIIQEDDYESNSEEDIEFHDITEEDADPAEESLMQQHTDQLVQQKIKQDIDRIDDENKFLDKQIVPVSEPEPETAPEPVPSVSSSLKLKAAALPKKKISMPLKSGGKTKIQPKIKNIGIKV
jgi:hypothetical protein